MLASDKGQREEGSRQGLKELSCVRHHEPKNVNGRHVRP